MKVLTFFNNKGGVGKTTLTANIAAFFAIEFQKRVLVIDCDPQCNITQLILGDEKTIELYWRKRSIRSRETLLKIIQPILDGDSHIYPDFEPLRSSENRFRVDLVPGDPQFSMMEDPLSHAWGQIPAGKPASFRTSFWLDSYLDTLSPRYDIALVDVGPSLGSINRSVLMASDYFVTPLGADIFSILGVRNIARWLNEWGSQYSLGFKYGRENNPEAVIEYGYQEELPILNGFVGYTLQQYIAKAKQGVRRPTAAFEKIVRNVPKEIENSLESLMPPNLGKDKAKLGDVPNLYSLIPLAQGVYAPIFALKSSDGLVGTQFKQSADYKEIIGALSKRIADNIALDHE